MSDDEVEEITSSISKGCFLFKPNNETQSRRKRKKKVALQEGEAEPYMTAYKNESSSERHLRYKLFESCWKDLEHQIQTVQTELNQKIFIDLVSFISHAHDEADKKMVLEIPTAALFTGVNLPDHHAVFNQLTDKLNANVTLFTAKLQSKDCSTLRLMLKSAMDGLDSSIHLQRCREASTLSLGDSEDNGSGDDEDERNIKKRKKKGRQSSFRDFTFKCLEEWYIDLCMHHAATGETEGPWASDSPPVVFILEDFERFPSQILRDFILICSSYVNIIPIVLMFGVATTMSAIHCALPHSVSSKLVVKKFQAQPSLNCLTEVIDKVMILITPCLYQSEYRSGLFMTCLL